MLFFSLHQSWSGAFIWDAVGEPEACRQLLVEIQDNIRFVVPPAVLWMNWWNTICLERKPASYMKTLSLLAVMKVLEQNSIQTVDVNMSTGQCDQSHKVIKGSCGGSCCTYENVCFRWNLYLSHCLKYRGGKIWGLFKSVHFSVTLTFLFFFFYWHNLNIPQHNDLVYCKAFFDCCFHFSLKWLHCHSSSQSVHYSAVFMHLGEGR